MAVKKNAAFIFIFITILLDVIGLGIIIPVFPGLIKELIHGDVSTASMYGGLLMFAYAIMQFIFSPVLGGLSDKYGRRPILLLSLLGFGIDYLFQGLAPTIGWLFVGRLIAGVMGASYTTATAYIADISEPEKRAQNFGMIGAAFGVGFILGPLIGGFLGDFGLRVPFYVAAGVTILNCIYGYLVLPESLAPENRRPFDWKRANPLGALKQIKKYPIIMGLAGAFFCIAVAGHSAQSTWTFYNELKFGWDPKMIGYSLTAVGVMIAIVQAGLTRVLVPKLGQANSVYIGFLLTAIGNVLFGFANEGWLMFIFIIPFAMGGISGPALQGIMSNQVPANEQGELQGALTSLMSITSIIGPIVMTGLFGYFTSHAAPFYFPGAPFIMGAVLNVTGLVLTWMSFRKNPID